mgnify:CR=1 FL=1
MHLVHGARPTARPAVPRRRARANGGASALLPAAAASCARNSQGRRATVRVGVHARRGAGEGGARRAAHMFRAPPPEARGVAARGKRAAIPRAGASLRCTHSCGALCCRPGRVREEPVTYRGLRNTCVQVCAPCLLRHPRIETDRAIWLVRPYLPNPDCMPVHYCRNRQGKLACSPLSSQPRPAAGQLTCTGQPGVFGLQSLVPGGVSTRHLGAPS